MKTNLTLLLILFILGACARKEDNDPDPNRGGEEGAKVTLAFTNEYTPSGRAFGTNEATAAEKKVTSAKIFIFLSDKKIFEKSLTSTEIGGIGTTPIKFTVPNMIASTAYDYYVFINKGDIIINSVSDLNTKTELDIASYNGAWADVSDTQATPKRPDGFVMTGKTTVSTGVDLTAVQPTVSVAAKRITAKLDITASIDQSVFGTGNKYPGTLTIDSAKIFKTQASTPLVFGTPTTTTGSQILGKQLSNPVTAFTTYQNRFYVFENGTIAAGNRVSLTLYGTYANDGLSTLVTYNVELTGSGVTPNGSIIRNGAYAINVTIQGLIGTSISVSITLSDWETIVTQAVNLGS